MNAKSDTAKSKSDEKDPIIPRKVKKNAEKKTTKQIIRQIKLNLKMQN